MWFWPHSKHQVSEQELNAYVDGQLAPDGRALLEEHLPSCGVCRDALDELRSLRSALRSLPRESAPRSFALRASDVEPATAARPLGLLDRAAPMLGGLTAAAVITFAVLVGVDVSDQGFGGAAGDSASRAAVPEAVAEGAEGEPSAELAAVPTGLNPSALQPDQTIQSIDQGDPVTETSAGMTATGDVGKAVDDGTAASEGGVPPTPCSPNAFCDQFGSVGATTGTTADENEDRISLTPCPRTALCPSVQALDDLPQVNPAAPFSVSPVDEEAGYDEQALLPYADEDADGEFESRRDGEGGAAAPISAQADGGYTRIRSAETAMAALAIVGAAALAIIWRRRRAEERR